MAPNDDGWKPALVRVPEKDPEGRTLFDWKDEKLLEWKANAIKMQEMHVKDNKRTEWFAYKPKDRDAIELRILIALYGIRIPRDATRRVPSCRLKMYEREEKMRAREIKKAIIKCSPTPENIHFNIIYISTATKSIDTDEFLASEEPVFVVKNGQRFIDKEVRTYSDFQDYVDNNSLPRGLMMYPRNGTYTPPVAGGGGAGGSNGGGGGGDDGGTSSGKSDGGTGDGVPLCSNETPASSVLQRIKAVTDTAIMIGGMVLSVTGVVSYFAPNLFCQAAKTAMTVGSYILSGYSTVGTFYGMYDKTYRKESIRTEVLLLISSAFSLYATRLNQSWTLDMRKYSREGKTFAELSDKISKLQKTIFASVNWTTMAFSAISFFSSIYDLSQKKERTWLDYYHLSMSTFTFFNVLVKPKTIQGIFESEQMQFLTEIQNELESEEAKEAMSEMRERHATSDQKAYLIRSLIKIENRTEFFELIHRTSTVTCTPDGLNVDNNIDIAPESYNDIGKVIMKDKIEQITRYREAVTEQKQKLILKNKLQEEFGKNLTREQSAELEGKLNVVMNLPPEERQEAMRNVMEQLQGGGAVDADTFNEAWGRAEGAANADVPGAVKDELDKQTKKMVDSMEERSYKTESEKKAYDARIEDLKRREVNGIITPEERQELQRRRDFDKLKDLAQKKVNRTITPEEDENLRKQIDTCVRHRKKHFFQSSADHRAGQPNPTSDEAFKKDIRTFTKGQGERLCYTIDVESVKTELRRIYNQQDLVNINVGGQRIFANMKISEYDRLNRVMKEYGAQSNRLIGAATNIANDPQFAGTIRTPHDLASVTEAINTEMQRLPQKERNEFLNNLANPPRDPNGNLIPGQYTSFRDRFNDRINQVNALDPNIRSQWSSPLSMAYHWWKHEKDFSKSGEPPVSIQGYFIHHAGNIFNANNLTTASHSQTGTIMHTYMRSFGPRVHVGFTSGPNRTINSHFTKEDPN